MKKPMRNFIILVILPAILMLFHNCGEFIPEGKLNKGLNCTFPDLFPTFSSTYYNFFQAKGCVNCHAPGTGNPGIPHFANPSATAGFTSFNSVGPIVLENKLKNGHQAYDFSSLETELNSHKVTWLEAQEKIICDDGSGKTTSGKTLNFFEPVVRFEFREILSDLVKIDNPGELDEHRYMENWSTLVWSLDSKVSGLEISVDFKVDVKPGFFYPNAYIVNNIKAKSPNSKVRIKSVTVLLNGSDHTVTTFAGIDSTVDPTDMFVNLNPGGADAIYSKDKAIDGDYSNDDLWSVRIELIELVP